MLPPCQNQRQTSGLPLILLTVSLGAFCGAFCGALARRSKTSSKPQETKTQMGHWGKIAELPTET
jgi:hypothetical protein